MDTTALAERACLGEVSDLEDRADFATAEENGTDLLSLPRCHRASFSDALASADIQAHSRRRAMPDTDQREGDARYVGDTRLTVAQLLQALTDRRSAAELLERFPRLDPQDIRDAVDYAAHQGLLS